MHCLDENCAVFKKMKAIDRLEVFKFMVNKDSKKIDLLKEDDCSPDVYIKNCHCHYDEKKII